jgi:hypothetical protein
MYITIAYITLVHFNEQEVEDSTAALMGAIDRLGARVAALEQKK